MMDTSAVDLLFVQSLSLSLLHAIWQGCVAASLAFAGFGLLRHTPHAKYLWGMLCLSVLAACPFLTFWWMHQAADANRGLVSTETGESISLLVSAKVDSATVPIAVLAEPIVALDPWTAAHLVIVSAWLLGQLLIGIRLLMSVFFIYRLKRLATPVQQEVRCIVKRLSSRIGIRCPHMASSAHVTGAMVAGFVRQTVVVPAAWLAEMTPEMLEAIIAHELSHIKRYDLWVNLIQRLVESMLFFHPAVWWLSARIREERELCCDLLAVQATNRRKQYAETLELVAHLVSARNPYLTTQIGGDRMSVLRRVRFVLGQQSNQSGQGWWPIGVLAVAISCGMMWLGHSKPSLAETENEGRADTVSLANVASDSRDPDKADQPNPFADPVTPTATTNGRIIHKRPEWKLGEYVIEPPDILLIEDIKLEPKDPYEVQPQDILQIVVVGTQPERPIAGQFLVEAGGVVNLGPGYGAVEVAGLTTTEAQEKIRKLLKRELSIAEVAVTVFKIAAAHITGEHLVAPDGTINLGVYGRVYVAGMTPGQAGKVVKSRLSTFFKNPKILLDVLAYNSKWFYIITEGGDAGDHVVRMPVTGNETVLDAIAQLGGLEQANTKRLYISRSVPGSAADQVLPIDWDAITRGVAAGTNYQLLPGDRLFITPVVSQTATSPLRQWMDIAQGQAGETINLSYDDRNLGANTLAWNRDAFHHRIPITGPVTSGGIAQVIDPPSDKQILNLIQVGSPDSRLLLPEYRDQVVVEKHLVADYVDPPKAYPLIGTAQLHHAHYKCLVRLEKNEEPQDQLTVYIDHTHLHVGENLQVQHLPAKVREWEGRQIPDELLTVSYDVGDLVLPIMPPEFSETAERNRVKDATPDFDTLVELIRSTIAPRSWDAVGGSGNLAPFEGNLSLVISQTQAVHDQIVDLLSQLRRLQETRIVLHATTLELPTKLTKRLGLHGKSFAALTARELEQILAAATGDPHARVFSRLKATLFDGQSMRIKVEDGLVLSIQGRIAGNGVRIAATLAETESNQTVSSAELTGRQGMLVSMRLTEQRADKTAFRLITAEATAGTRHLR